MTNHVWVRITILQLPHVELLMDGDEEVFTYHYETASRLKAEEESAFGCYLCDLPLTAENFRTECEGVPDDLEAMLLSLAGSGDDDDADESSGSPQRRLLGHERDSEEGESESSPHDDARGS